MTFRGIAYRAHNPRWSWGPMSGEGAALHGGRFNPRGAPALYLSIDHNTAILEASHGLALKFQPLTLVAYEVDCADVVDLRRDEQRTLYGITDREFKCAWKVLAEAGRPVPTWQIAGRLMSAGRAGVLVHSFAPGATLANVNLVLWTWGPDLPHRIVVIDDERRLPRNDLSWRDRD